MKVLGIETSCDETAAAVVEMIDASQPTKADALQGAAEQQTEPYAKYGEGAAQSATQQSAANDSGVAGSAGQQAGVVCQLLSNVVASSADLHVQYGGVVPEIAARSHIEVILPVIKEALEEANCTWDDIDGIAVTYGAGLGGSLLIGVMTARTLAATLDKPLYAINHVEAHIYANFLTSAGPHLQAVIPTEVEGSRSKSNGISRQARDDIKSYTFPAKQPEFPMLAILVSGGHSQLVLFQDHFDYQLLGQTHDDAIGEAFDKVAKILGLPYPGGPSVSKAAEKGDPNRYKFPKAKMSKYDFSFSGLKTAILRQAQAEIGEGFNFPSFKLSERLSEAQKRDIAASFQRVAVETIVDKAKLACEEFSPKSVVIAGGVGANQELRRQLTEVLSLPVQFPDLKLCTDNGAMVATLGCFKMRLNQPPADPYSLEIQPNLSM